MDSGELARQRTHTLDESVLVDPEESDRPVVDFLGSTPGRLALVAVVLVVALLAVGVTASKTVSDRQGRLETLRSHTEPLADAAQRIYGAVSFANTTAATAFLSGGVEPDDVRDRYDAAIGQASAGLVTASNGVSPNDIRSLTLLTDISNQLAVYTGLLATARANNRAGRPIGVAYLSESSTLMQQTTVTGPPRGLAPSRMVDGTRNTRPGEAGQGNVFRPMTLRSWRAVTFGTRMRVSVHIRSRWRAGAVSPGRTMPGVTHLSGSSASKRTPSRGASARAGRRGRGPATWRPSSAAMSAVSTGCSRLPIANTPDLLVRNAVSVNGPACCRVHVQAC